MLFHKISVLFLALSNIDVYMCIQYILSLICAVFIIGCTCVQTLFHNC